MPQNAGEAEAFTATPEGGEIESGEPVLWIAVTRGAVVTVGLTVGLAWPDRTSATTAKIIATTILVSAITTFATERRVRISDPIRRRSHYARIGLFAVVGIALLVWPAASVRVIGRLIGTGLMVLGVAGACRGARHATDQERVWGITRGALTASIGIVMFATPERAAALVIISIVIAWAAEAAIALVVLAGDEEVVHGSAWSVASAAALQRVEQFEMDEDHRQTLTESLYFEGPGSRDRLSRFAILVALSTTIAALGIIGDSTAVVVGSMLIAPLMTPIMATAGALVMVWPTRAVRALTTVLGGVVLSITVAWLLTGLLPQASDAILNSSQVTSRINPTSVDLLVALAAGAAGAYALSRPDVSDSLPGVAIAVALVPPLGVVGITIQLHAWNDAVGALLLFLTNLVAIILAGGAVFLLAGFTPIGHLRSRSADVRRSFAVVGVLVLVIAVPLGLTGKQLLADAAAYDEAEAAVARWSEGTSLELVGIDINGAEVEVVVAGAGDPGSVDKLGELMERALRRDLELTVLVIPTLEFHYESDG